MDKKINLLNEETIGKIAAGEVVERPASVVKELIENSIDAGADSIEVEIDRAGQNLIRVADNGSGMDADDALMAFKRHATSKIKDIDDLGKITTLGFRGEALASIAAVSQIDITTKRDIDNAGVYMYIESGQVQKTRPAARDRGTTIEVRNLFYNVPARRKFLKKESTEMSEIVEVFSRFILSHAGTGFKLTQNGRCILDAPAEMDIRRRIGIILGDDVPRGMIPAGFKSEYVSVDGMVSVPAFTRKDKRSQIFFVNGRYVRSRVLNDALYDSYRSLLERGRFPLAVLFITLPPDKMDVNVHPAKLEIKFEDENAVKAAISQAIAGSFNDFKRTVGSHEGNEQDDQDLTEFENDMSVMKACHDNQSEFKYEIPSGSGVPAGNGPSWVSQRFQGERTSGIMFQLEGSYIVRTREGSLLITDQHAAHERVLYEFFSKVFDKTTLESQRLLFPLRVDFSVSETAMMKNIMPGFNRLGFEIEGFGESSFIIRAIPSVIKTHHAGGVVKDIISDLLSSGSPKIEYMEELVKLVSCRSAVKSGDALSFEEMEDLLFQLERCELPFTCPHGRPTTIEISTAELGKRFRRT